MKSRRKSQAGFSSIGFLLMATLIHAVILFVEGKCDFDGIGALSIGKSGITTYGSNLHAKASNAIWSVRNDVFIFRISPNVEERSAIVNGLKLRPVDMNWFCLQRRMSAHHHANCFSGNRGSQMSPTASHL